MSTCANAEREDCLSLGDCAMVKPDRSSAFDLVRTSASSGIAQPRCVVACKYGNALNFPGKTICTVCSEAVLDTVGSSSGLQSHASSTCRCQKTCAAQMSACLLQRCGKSDISAAAGAPCMCSTAAGCCLAERL